MEWSQLKQWNDDITFKLLMLVCPATKNHIVYKRWKINITINCECQPGFNPLV